MEKLGCTVHASTTQHFVDPSRRNISRYNCSISDLYASLFFSYVCIVIFLDSWNLPKYLCIDESFFVGHINIMRALFQGNFCFTPQQTSQLKMGQLDSLVVHLLYFRGYEQHIQIGRLLHMLVLTQSSCLGSHPKSAGGWRHGVGEGGRLE